MNVQPWNRNSEIIAMNIAQGISIRANNRLSRIEERLET